MITGCHTNACTECKLVDHVTRASQRAVCQSPSRVYGMHALSFCSCVGSNDRAVILSFSPSVFLLSSFSLSPPFLSFFLTPPCFFLSLSSLESPLLRLSAFQSFTFSFFLALFGQTSCQLIWARKGMSVKKKFNRTSGIKRDATDTTSDDHDKKRIKIAATRTRCSQSAKSFSSVGCP